MSDVETETEWSHLLGRGMAGKLKGKELVPIISDMVTWDVWRSEYPNTSALKMSRTSENYTREFYDNPTRFVFGVKIAGRAWSLAMDQMLKRPVHNMELGEQRFVATFHSDGAVASLFSREVAGQTLDFEQVNATTMKDRQTGTLWSMIGGKALEGTKKGQRLQPQFGIMSYRKAWKTFYPDSSDVEF